MDFISVLGSKPRAIGHVYAGVRGMMGRGSYAMRLKISLSRQLIITDQCELIYLSKNKWCTENEDPLFSPSIQSEYM